MSISDNIARIKETIAEAAIKAGRNPDDIKLMAVTKTVSANAVNEAILCGTELIGENRVQEIIAKEDSLKLNGCKLHLIGHLQTNKIKQAVGRVHMIQSVDSTRVAGDIARCSLNMNICTDVLVEVNIGEEVNKFGVPPEKLEQVLSEIAELKGISVKGLMCVPPFSENSDETRSYFYNMNKLFVDMRYKKMDNIHMDILSMGMSGDFIAAITEGSTLVRIGSAIFGQRNYN